MYEKFPGKLAMKIMCTELSQIDKRCIHVVFFFFLFDIFRRSRMRSLLFDVRRSRIRSLLTYFCNYGRFCLTILKMKIFSNFFIGDNTNLVRVRRTDLKHL